MRRIPNPFAEPEGRFTVSVVARRPRAVSGPAPRDDVDLSTAIPAVSADLLARVRARAQTVRYAGDVIIRQGDPADRFYILTAGRVEVLREHRDQAPPTLLYLERGAYFGEIGLLHDVPRTATVRAVSASTAITIDRADFRKIVAESDLTAAEISAVVQRRMMSLHLADALPSLTAEQIAHVAPRFAVVRHPAGETIIRQGDAADRFYILSRGEVEVVNHHPGGEDIFPASLGPADYFGEVGVVHDQPRMATVRALTPPAAARRSEMTAAMSWLVRSDSLSKSRNASRSSVISRPSVPSPQVRTASSLSLSGRGSG
jgi:CRP-like cAMP-binding protein